MNPFLGPRRLIGLGLRTAEGVVRAPEHVAALWDEVNTVVRRASRLLNRADLIAARMEHELEQLHSIAEDSKQLLHDGRTVAAAAGGTTAAARGTRELAQDQVERLRRMIDLYQPLLESLAPLGAEAANALRPAHLRGLVSLLNELPQLVNQLQPALQAMESMGPDMGEMSERMDNVAQVVEGLPGAKMLRRRGQTREEEATEAPDGDGTRHIQ